jgi:methyl coenzyme M reductase gamma subunit
VVKLIKNGLHRDEISLQYRIFNKTEDMVEYWQDKIGVEWEDSFEVWDGYDEDKEMLRISELKELVN